METASYSCQCMYWKINLCKDGSNEEAALVMINWKSVVTQSYLNAYTLGLLCGAV